MAIDLKIGKFGTYFTDSTLGIDLTNVMILDRLKEVEALRRALKSHGEIIEMNAKLNEDLKWALEVQDELNLLVGHRGSNEEDRKTDSYYNKSHELKIKHKIT